ncbi:MAG: septum formation inhibitor Maf [Deltaproteobacteria bacterium]|nr:septum formation inhibitor Maf [Deltaproteobacteria bacterium]
MKLVLASASPRRRELLEATGLKIEIRPVCVDETIHAHESPQQAVQRLARLKAVQGHEENPDRFVLAADTIVVCNGRIMGKPKTIGEAGQMLGALSGRSHQVITGFAVVSPQGETSIQSVSTKVVFKNLCKEEIDWYIKTDEPMDKAGAYGIQGKAAALVKSVHGSYTNVVGLPLAETLELLAHAGWKGFPPGE